MSELVTTCPFCAEPIEQGLSVCPWCDSRLGDEPPADGGPDSPQEMPASAEPVEVRPVEGPPPPDDATSPVRRAAVEDPAATRYCDQCGASLPARARFCGLCGAPAGL
jgi:Double zinc ribbon